MGFPSIENVNIAQNQYHNTDSPDGPSLVSHHSSIPTKKPQMNLVQSGYQQSSNMAKQKDPQTLNHAGTRRDHPDMNFFEAQSDSYDAMSTEPTPSQVRLSSPESMNQLLKLQSQTQKTNKLNLTNSIRNINGFLGDTVDLNTVDDAHTTRGLVGHRHSTAHLSSFHNLGSQEEDQPTLSSQLADHQLVSLVDPHPGGNKIDEQEDLVTSSFSRTATGSLGLNQNTTDVSSINPAMMTNLLSSVSLHNQRTHKDQLLNSETPYSQISSPLNQFNQNRGSVPLSMLLSDLIKLARPHQANGDHQQPSVDRGIQPTSQGILQQLKSLPSPFLSFLHTLSPSSLSNSWSANSGLTPTSTNNDASESNQHYQNISILPADLSALLARSMRSASAPLPAFPAPKGYVESTWNERESPDQFQAGQNVNADFVANNAAGFVRFSQQPSGNEQQISSQTSMRNRHSEKMDQNQRSNNEQQPNMNLITEQAWSQPPTKETYIQETQRYQSQPLMLNNKQDQSQIMASQLTNVMNANGVMVSNQPINYQSGMNQYQRALTTSVAPSNLNQVQQPNQNLHRPQYQTINHQLLNNIQGKPNLFNLNENSQILVNQVANGYPMQPIGMQQISLALDSNVKANSAPAPNQNSGLARGQSRQMASPHAGNRSNRRRRSISKSRGNFNLMPDPYEAGSQHDEDIDSAPLSIVTTDGRPMSDEKVEGLLRSGFSRTRINNQEAHGIGEYGSPREEQPVESRPQIGFQTSPQDNQYQTMLNDADERHNSRRKTVGYNKRNKDENHLMDTASSGLMTKLLLGTASTNDEFEDDMNDDDETASEKRKEELEDAEFGIFKPVVRGSKNSKSSAASTRANASAKSRDSKLKSGKSPHKSESGKSDEGSTMRNQQRADLEFYGHPGEETRQLKYGILGSGNYEVYNGGVYSENDEVASAVNSVANYARKPTGSLALKLLGDDALRLNSHMNPGRGRLDSLIRGASVHTNADGEAGLLGFMPEVGGLAGSDRSALVGNPLLDLIYPTAGNSISPFMDSSLMSQLDSNTRTVHADKQDHSVKMKEGKVELKERDRHQVIQMRSRGQGDERPNKKIYEGDDNSNEGRKLKQTIRHKHEHTSGNADQFNSYVISPSKKVNIFSDKDLDSAPSDMDGRAIRRMTRV